MYHMFRVNIFRMMILVFTSAFFVLFVFIRMGDGSGFMNDMFWRIVGRLADFGNVITIYLRFIVFCLKMTITVLFWLFFDPLYHYRFLLFPRTMLIALNRT